MSAAGGVLALLLAAGPAGGADGRPDALREVGFDQKPGQLVPGDITLRDEAGRPVPLSSFYGRRPLVLSLVYYECPMLCTLVLNGLASALGVLSFDAGREFDVLTVSIEPRETPALAAAKKAGYLARYRRPTAEQGWRFLTGDAHEVARLAGAVGFRYAWDEETRQYAHPSGLVVLTPEGRISRYLFGIEYAPKDLRLAVVESSQGKVGGLADNLILYCYRYDPERGRYGAAILRLVRAAGVLTVLALATFIVVMRRRERRAGGPRPQGA